MNSEEWGLADPINLLLRQYATEDTVDRDWEWVFGWDSGLLYDGAHMRFNDHWTWSYEDAQRADGCKACRRRHVRWNAGPHFDSGGYGHYTIAGAHKDKYAFSWEGNCDPLQFFGHRGTEFNETALYIADEFNDRNFGVNYWDFYQGNTEYIYSCDGSRARSHGYVHMIWIGQ